MTAEPEFETLRPRRIARPRPQADEVILAESALVAPPLEAASNPLETVPLEVAPLEVAPLEVAPLEVAPLEAKLREAAPLERAAAPLEAPRVSEDDEIDASVLEADSQIEMLRAEATRFAAIACARALRVSLAENAGTVARFVDDALRACGRIDRANVRLHPLDAGAYRPERGVDVTADALLERGEVVVETELGTVRATIDQRAHLLVKAAADA